MSIINNISSENIFDVKFAQDKEKRHLAIRHITSITMGQLTIKWITKKSVYTNSY